MMLNTISASVARWVQNHLVLFLALVLIAPVVLFNLWIVVALGRWPLLYYLLMGSVSDLALLLFWVWCLRNPSKFMAWADSMTKQPKLTLKPERKASLMLAGIVYVVFGALEGLFSSLNSFPFSLGWAAVALFLVASYEKVLEVRTKPAIEFSTIFFLIASGYLLLSALVGFWGGNAVILCVLASGAAFIASVESHKYLSLVRKAYQKSESSYQVEPLQGDSLAGLLPFIYYSGVSYDGVLYRVDGDLNDPFRSQQMKLPLASIPLDESAFLWKLEHQRIASVMLLLASGFGLLVTLLGGRFSL